MNAALKAKNAYGKARATTRTPIDIEYELIGQLTHRIIAAAQKGKPGFNDLVAALHDNQKLWTTFAADIAYADNALPDALKTNIVYLSQFTAHHTGQVLARKADVRPLVEINTAIMRGLRSGAP
ncbi:flagellar biosynthesis regulator FlaF [Epibacterium ulvae]|uniref:flagellar biosynthesis regulator FlaF n=1 Tax=Epibacterium ulvae TaxID=1156985 RepID=UPI0024916B6E|nr:flagellar biosynthesis regulator FlaF [Epibacterium ulvae]